MFFSIDVEPHGFQTHTAEASRTDGYDAMANAVTRLRARLADVGGRTPKFGWYLRMDPQIANAYGRADHFVTAFGDRVGELTDAGDYLGLHTHLLRWDAGTDRWVHDTSPSWVREAIESSVEAFEVSTGGRCRLHRSGAAIHTLEVVKTLNRVGVLAEMALEPVTPAVREVAMTSIDSSPLIGAMPSLASAPRVPYVPSDEDFLRAGGTGLTIIPMTTTRLSSGTQRWRPLIGSLVRRRRLPPARVTYPWARMEPRIYWDSIASQMRLMRRPYVNIAVRTDLPSTSAFQRVVSLLDALIEHPLAPRLEFVDPLDALPDLRMRHRLRP